METTLKAIIIDGIERVKLMGAMGRPNERSFHFRYYTLQFIDLFIWKNIMLIFEDII